MSDADETPGPDRAKARREAQAPREARLAAALRANLRRRKAAAAQDKSED